MISPIEVVLADDHAMIREALTRLLAETDGVRVIGQAADAVEARLLVERTRPHVLVLDYSMPGLDALSTIRLLGRAHPELQILVLTLHESIHYAVRVLEAGAHGYVVKSAGVEELVEGIRAVHQGEIYISPKVSQRVLQQLRRPRADRVGLAALSDREFQLLRTLGAGMSLKKCSHELSISISTASMNRSRLMAKLSLRTTAEVIRFAIENDIVG